MNYITTKRFKGMGIEGYFNLPYGTVCTLEDGFLVHDGRYICAVHSENGWEFFRPNTEEGRKRQIMLDKLYRHYECGKGDMEDFSPDRWLGATNTYWKNLLRTMPTDRLIAFYRKRLGDFKEIMHEGGIIQVS